VKHGGGGRVWSVAAAILAWWAGVQRRLGVGVTGVNRQSVPMLKVCCGATWHE